MENSNYLQANQKLNLFSYHPQLAGIPFWHPAGLKLYNNLKNFIWDLHASRQYQQVKSPSICPIEMFAQSGHLDKYRDLIYPVSDSLALRPMSCPNHIFIYNSRPRSYRELPFKLFEFGEVFRNEPSGSLQSLFRLRQFCQDDSHIFLSLDDLSQVINQYLLLSQEAYQKLKFEQVSYKISLRPDNRAGSDQLWDQAESILIKELSHLNPEIVPGDGAFYGPKLELHIKDHLNRSWQLGVLQLDFVLPEKFDLSFIDSQSKQSPIVIIHHAVLGSLERMIGILLEIHGVNLPAFLHPYPQVVLPISEKFHGYADLINKKFNIPIDYNNAPLKEKIAFNHSRGSQIIVVGEKEENLYKQSQIFYGSYRQQKQNVIKEITPIN